MPFETPIDIATPEGTESIGNGDDRIREVKSGIQELLAVDHEASLTVTEINSADSGCHNKVTLLEQSVVPSAPTGVASNFGILYTKQDTYSGNSELFYKDEDGRSYQITKDNRINLNTNYLDNDNYINALNFVGDGFVNMIKVGTGNKCIISDGSQLSASTQSGDPDLTIADKKYVDDEIAAAIAALPSLPTTFWVDNFSAGTIFVGSASLTGTVVTTGIGVEALCLFRIEVTDADSTDREITVFNNSDTSTGWEDGCNQAFMGRPDRALLICSCDSDGKVKIAGSSSGGVDLTMHLLGYIK